MNKLSTLKVKPIRRGALKPKRHREQAGFTIIESLAAIIVVTIMLVGITPMLAIAVATRVQARRVELGSQAARTYIDHLRTDQFKKEADQLGPSQLINQAPPAPWNIQSIPLPSPGSLTCPTNGAYCSTPARAYCVDGDGDGKCTTDSMTDMIVWGAGYNPTASAKAGNGYTLLTLVYRADAFSDGGSLTSTTQQSTFTGGSGDRKAPVAIITTEISGTGSNSYKDIRCRVYKSSQNPSRLDSLCQ